jgi:hypothetical protein
MDTTYTETTPPGPRAEADRSRIAGWGADLDHANRPAYPKERTPPRPCGRCTGRRRRRSLQHVEILHSTERRGITPVFGTSTPPSGISGMLRRLAFRYSENDIRHWLVLLFADRVNVGEGLASDLAHGHSPTSTARWAAPPSFATTVPARCVNWPRRAG